MTKIQTQHPSANSQSGLSSVRELRQSDRRVSNQCLRPSRPTHRPVTLWCAITPEPAWTQDRHPDDKRKSCVQVRNT
nr:hypothetical protein CFP56_10317 [Quercus suber]